MHLEFYHGTGECLPSLAGLTGVLASKPTVETVGYCQPSLAGRIANAVVIAASAATRAYRVVITSAHQSNLSGLSFKTIALLAAVYGTVGSGTGKPQTEQ